MLFTKPLVFALMSVLVIAFLYSSFSMTDVSGRRMSSITCNWYQSMPVNRVECCAVDLDTGTNWCVECDAGSPPSNCSGPYISMGPFDIQQPTPTPRPTPTPLGPLGIPEDGAIQQPTPAPTSPLGPRPFTPLGEGTIQEPQTTPTPAPQGDQGDNRPGPFTGPLGGGVLQEPEEDEESNEEEEESSSEDEGPDTGGPLT